MFLLDIPNTNRQTYISGIQALNIPDKTSGDWHFHTVWLSDVPKQARLYGDGQEFNTNAIYGDYGIADKKGELLKLRFPLDGIDQVFVANHFRAILDLAYFGAKNETMNAVVGSTMDFLDSEEQKQEVLELAKKMVDYLTEPEQAVLSQWIEHEGRQSYRGIYYGKQ